MYKTFYVNVRGITHKNEDGSSREEIAKNLSKGQEVQLIAEPQNEHDRWAVKVMVNEKQIGFLPSDARDASAVLRGEPITARVHKFVGGTNWFNRTILGKRNIGVVLELRKGEPDWSRYTKLTDSVQPIDDLIQLANETEKSGDTDKAISLYYTALKNILEINSKDRVASAHRRFPAPVNRLTLLLEKKKDYESAYKIIKLYYKNFDPVQPNKTDKEAIRKRFQRLQKKLGNPETTSDKV